MLNCDESKSLRGVDMLLTSNTGIGDVSLAAELRRGKKKNIPGHNVTEYYYFLSDIDDLSDKIAHQH